MLLLTVGHSNVGNTAKSFDYLFCEHGLSCQGLLLLKKIAVPLFFNVLSNTTVHFRWKITVQSYLVAKESELSGPWTWTWSLGRANYIDIQVI